MIAVVKVYCKKYFARKSLIGRESRDAGTWTTKREALAFVCEMEKTLTVREWEAQASVEAVDGVWMSKMKNHTKRGELNPSQTSDPHGLRLQMWRLENKAV